MSDTQLCLVTGVPIIAVMLSMLFNQVRINDMRNLLRAQILASRGQTRADIADLKSMIQVLMSKLDEIDTRLTRVEERLAGR